MAKLKVPCTKCGVLCSGQLQIETRKGSYKPFCSTCFTDLELTKTIKEIRKKLKKN